MAATKGPDDKSAKITPLQPQFVVDTTQQLLLIMNLCQELGYQQGWMSNITRRPLWRNAILYHRKHHKRFEDSFKSATVAFTKPLGITYINQCLVEAGVGSQLAGDVSNAYFIGTPPEQPEHQL